MDAETAGGGIHLVFFAHGKKILPLWVRWCIIGALKFCIHF